MVFQDELLKLATRVRIDLSTIRLEERISSPVTASPTPSKYAVNKIADYEKRLIGFSALIHEFSDAMRKEVEIVKVLDPFLWIAENKPDFLSNNAKRPIENIRKHSTCIGGCDIIPAFRIANDILRIAKEAVEYPFTRPAHMVNSALRRLPTYPH